MTLRKMPKIENFELPEGLDFPGVSGDFLQRWSPELEVANLASDGTVIEIYDVIGGDSFFGGVSSRYVANQLRGASDVTVNINSPGGSFVEGNAIYNLLSQHAGKVTVNVLSMAASAAAVIAMAGDVVNIAPSGFMFIHNGQASVEGDRHDMTEVADLLAKIDDALNGIFVARTGLGKRKVADMLDAETTLSAKEAIENGFADKILDPGQVSSSSKVKNELETVRVDRLMEFALQRQFPGLSRSDRLNLKNAYRKGEPSAVVSTTRDAGLGELADELRRMISTL